MTTQSAFTLQAEDMNLSGGYRIASYGGETFIENRSCDPGVASTTFSGQTGTYDIALDVYDECDGESLIELLVDGFVVATINLNENGGSNYIAGSQRQVTFEGIEIPEGATFSIRGTRDDGEMARVDAITFEPVSIAPPTVTNETTIIELKFDDESDKIDSEPTAESEVQNAADLYRGAKIKNDALLLDGKNDYAVVADDAAFDVANGELEIVFNADDTDRFRALASRDSCGFDGGGHLTVYINCDQLFVRLQSGDKSYWLSSGHNSIQEHRDYTMNLEFGDDGMKLLINGQVVDTNDYTGGLGGNDEPWVIGASAARSSDGQANNLNGFFDGEIKNFKLTAKEEAPAFDAVDDAYTTGEDDVLTGNLFDNDVSAEGAAIAALSNGTVGEAIALADDLGTLTVNADGTFTLTPGEGANALNDGETATVTFDYQVQVGTTETPTAETTTIDFETFSRGDTVTRVEGASVWVDARGKGAKHDEAMIFDSNNPSGGDWDLRTNTQNNILIISEDSHQWDPDDNAAGGKIFFKFDNESTVESLTFIDNEEGAWVGFFDANWNQVGGSKWVSGTGDNSINTVSFNAQAATYMLVDLKGSGAIDDLVYTADTGVVVEPVYETATATITIVGEDDLKLVADSFTTTENAAGVGNLLANDVEAVAIDSISLGALGTDIAVTTDGGRSGTLNVAADGSFTYTPGADADGMVDGESDTLTFTYSVDDKTATVTITISGETDLAVARNDTATTDEDTTVSGNVLLNDTAGDLGLTVASVAGGVVGAAVAVTTAAGRTVDVTINADGSYTATPTTGFDDLDAGAADTAEIAYTLGDGSTATLSITIDGVTDNKAPILVNTRVSTDEDTAVSANVLNGAVDPDGDAITVLSTSLGAVGQDLTVITDQGFTGTVRVEADGSFTFTPGETVGFLSSDQIDGLTFTFTATDTFGNTSSETVSVLIDGRNDAPTVGSVLATTVTEDTGVQTLDLLDGAFDQDLNDTLSVTGLAVTGGDERGAVTLNGSNLEIDTDAAGVQSLGAGQSEVITYSYTVSDGRGGSIAQSATVTIEGVNDAPTVAAPILSSSFDNDVEYNFDLLDGASDIDAGDSVSVSNLSATGGKVGATNTGVAGVSFVGNVMTVDPSAYDELNDGESVQIDVTFDVIDENGGVTPQTATITVRGINDDPIAVDDSFTIGQRTALDANILAGTVLTNDTLVDSDTITVTSINGQAVGSVVALSIPAPDGSTYTAEVVMDAAGNFTFTQIETTGIALGETEDFTFSYTIADEDGGTSTATVTVGVEGANETPVALDDVNFETNEENQISGNLLENDTDGDFNDVLSVEGISVGTLASIPFTTDGGRTGTLRLDSNGNFIFTPNEQFQSLNMGETDTFSINYTASDGQGGFDTATAAFTIFGLDEPVVTPVTDDIINLVFVIDNSISMSAAYTDQFQFFEQFVGTIDSKGNQNTERELVDLAIDYTNLLTEAVSDNRDIAQPDFVNAAEMIGPNGERIDVSALTPEERGGTVVKTAIVGFSDDVDFFRVYEVDDTEIQQDLETQFDNPGGAGSNYTAALQQVYDYLAGEPLARQTKIYFISDGNSTSTGFEAVADSIETDFGAEIESIALAPSLSGGVNATTRANAIATGSYDSLNAIDTQQPGDFMDVVTSFRYVSTLSAAEDDEFEFDPAAAPTILDQTGELLDEYLGLLI